MVTDLSREDEEKLLSEVRKNPELGKCFLEMLELVGDDLGGIDLADDAEEAVVENIRKTGKELLTTWAQKKADLTAKKAKVEVGTRCHEKKSSNGIRP